VTDEAIRTVLERYWSDIGDHELYEELYDEDVVVEFPQGGERIRGRENLRAMRVAYPAAVIGTLQHMRGGGDLWVTELLLTYDGVRPTYGVSIMEVRGGKVARETIYAGEPWESPAWRSEWVELMERPTDPAPPAVSVGER
jgi:hypothetical protein